MFGFVMTYIFGVATGMALILINKYNVDKAVRAAEEKADKKLREKDNELHDLREKCNRLKRDMGWDDGYQQGLEDGIRRGKNMSEGEKLEDALSRGGHRKTTMGGGAK